MPWTMLLMWPDNTCDGGASARGDDAQNGTIEGTQDHATCNTLDAAAGNDGLDIVNEKPVSFV